MINFSVHTHNTGYKSQFSARHDQFGLGAGFPFAKVKCCFKVIVDLSSKFTVLIQIGIDAAILSN